MDEKTKILILSEDDDGNTIAWISKNIPAPFVGVLTSFLEVY